MSTPLFSTSAFAIIPSEGEMDAMARRRHQSCPVQRTRTKGSKNDQWYIRYRLDFLAGDGKTEYKEAPAKYLGYVREIGIRAAERLRDEFLETINRPNIVIPSQVKFGVVLEKYLNNCSVRDSSLDRYKSAVAAHIGPRWGETRMCDIRQLDVEQWLLQVSRTRGKSSFGKIKTVFSAAWNAAIRWGYTQSANPITLLPEGFGCPKPAQVFTMPTEQEFARFIAAVDGPWRLAAQIMMYTGMRVSEVLGLRWSDFDGETMRIGWTVTQKGERLPITKTENSARLIPVGHLRSLAVRPSDSRPSDWMFPADYFSINRAIKRASKRVGMDSKGFASHMFRRGFNTMFRRASNVEMAMQQLGHTSAAMNDRYFYPGDVEMAARAKVAELVMGQVSGVVN